MVQPEQERRGVLAGIGQGGDRAGRHGDLAEGEASILGFLSQRENRSAADEEQTVRASGAKRRGQVGMSERCRNDA